MSHQPGKGPNATPKVHARVTLLDGKEFVALLPGASIDEAHYHVFKGGDGNYAYLEERHSLPDLDNPIIDELGVAHPGVKTISTFHHVAVADIVAVVAP